MDKWNFYEESGDGEIAKFDTCLNISFNENGELQLQNREKLIRKFNWQLNNSILIVRDSIFDFFKPFPDSSIVSIQIKNSLVKMSIISFDKKNTILIKTISK